MADARNVSGSIGCWPSAKIESSVDLFEEICVLYENSLTRELGKRFRRVSFRVSLGWQEPKKDANGRKPTQESNVAQRIPLSPPIPRWPVRTSKIFSPVTAGEPFPVFQSGASSLSTTRRSSCHSSDFRAQNSSEILADEIVVGSV